MSELPNPFAEHPVWADLAAEQQRWLSRSMHCSPWLAQWLDGRDDDWAPFATSLNAEVNATGELAALSAGWTLDDEAQVMRDLRLWRNRQLARLIVRDANGLSTVRETALAVSDLADAAIAAALDYAQRFWSAQWGEPGPSEFGETHQQLVVLAMGKHGARELNLSSDIDLIFAFPSEGETANGHSHEAFFTRVGRKLIQLLDTRTEDGFVFRVDMRLRPWGQSGALVSNFNAMARYYTQQGREWERYAMIKARPVTGVVAAQAALMAELKPFVYRRYVDFQALGALRRLKDLIQKEVRRQGLEDNIKLGRGGIREVEFIAQAFQLIRGGQDADLQQTGTWPVLALLAGEGYLPAKVVTELTDGYDFLRDLEHRIQALHDEQTQRLPADQTDLERLALSLNLADVETLLAQLDHHRQRIHHHFNQVIADDSDADAGVDARWQQFWQQPEQVPDGVSVLAAEAIRAFHDEPAVARLGGESRANLDRLMPLLLTELARNEQLEQGFLAIRPILEAVLRRSVYFVLLAENPAALRELCRLAPASPWIAQTLENKPYLLDELTDPDSLYRLPDRIELRDELHQMLLRIPGDDLEQQMEVMRHFRHGRVLRAAACEVTNALPLMNISDYLAWVGEVVVEQALALAWQPMVERHGRPSRDNGDWCELDFGVIAYGKMGGLELSYESDLDLVFLHDAASQGETEGPKVIDNPVFMARLGQKLIHLLSAQTPSGSLYEVDARLRPSGNSGLLVSSLAAFEKYQQEKAWTWEHQALVRARFIAGDPAVQQRFEQIRAATLCRVRDRATLRQDVVEMRAKMTEHLSSGDNTMFDIKQDAGGIVDVEFMVQYGVLSWASDYPELTRWSDNIRCLEQLHRVGYLDQAEHRRLLSAYLVLRREVHRRILERQGNRLDGAEVSDELAAVRAAVMNCWQALMETEPRQPKR
ncbi:bifunctional [glutamate--ammonia ligase]-adenylyl-L-tyrosine phosphorylase/[glutamate--ammonia-ligase] adenylyltransferase [Saccharospirillum mangrovi]|uniref:bifunctional [glutamate--ammonia ligase]-adenylyl-L-tyrosine phosphorylase/[glutamate--ammonia-ligase] adenylyltransferase n=1 Tax=Saccharospirillum mangrovi TaxID=2161747 RepID=UPI000D33A2C6|nr:bifunctional [glutamate--ammonia ligase]-adenylyl-L-tyrosine phosphorylase/[glutamate--ammonia-ligase] adenylyltransferase [Saccharospirillum mangrovi]